MLRFDSMDRDQRKSRRIHLATPAEVKFESWAVFYETWIENISHGGMQLQLGKAPTVGEVIEVRLCPPKGEAVVLEAKVKFVNAKVGSTHGVGVEFVNLDDERKAAIERLIDDAS